MGKQQHISRQETGMASIYYIYIYIHLYIYIYISIPKSDYRQPYYLKVFASDIPSHLSEGKAASF